MVTPPPASRGSPGLSPPQLAAEKPASQHDGARAALLALREEHVRLREANLKLRERELNKRQEIDSLTVARDLTAKELAAVQEDLEESKQEPGAEPRAAERAGAEAGALQRGDLHGGEKTRGCPLCGAHQGADRPSVPAAQRAG
ncbi:unnamed protein product [Effrenium voratum]|uniref:Uncharacterized protein n=1 Tax=Effrenium voratum TaxID=2562239 RepID=A0AA36HN66_9DINO|nr:unnamed protein product [Effrenium voratum]